MFPESKTKLQWMSISSRPLKQVGGAVKKCFPSRFVCLFVCLRAGL